MIHAVIFLFVEIKVNIGFDSQVTGPWRSLWVRLGYDPRKMPDSKKYQLLDFRIRCSTKHGNACLSFHNN